MARAPSLRSSAFSSKYHSPFLRAPRRFRPAFFLSEAMMRSACLEVMSRSSPSLGAVSLGFRRSALIASSSDCVRFIPTFIPTFAAPSGLGRFVVFAKIKVHVDHFGWYTKIWFSATFTTGLLSVNTIANFSGFCRSNFDLATSLSSKSLLEYFDALRMRRGAHGGGWHPLGQNDLLLRQ